MANNCVVQSEIIESIKFLLIIDQLCLTYCSIGNNKKKFFVDNETIAFNVLFNEK